MHAFPNALLQAQTFAHEPVHWLWPHRPQLKVRLEGVLDPKMMLSHCISAAVFVSIRSVRRAHMEIVWPAEATTAAPRKKPCALCGGLQNHIRHV